MLTVYFHCFTLLRHIVNVKYLSRKIPGGVFGRDGEMQLFSAVELPDDQQVHEIRR